MASAATPFPAPQRSLPRGQYQAVKIWEGPWGPLSSTFVQEQEFPYGALTSTSTSSLPVCPLEYDSTSADVASVTDTISSSADSEDEDFFCFTPLVQSTSGSDGCPSLTSSRSSSLHAFHKSPCSSTAGSAAATRSLFTAPQLAAATGGWAKENILGVGGSGAVYKGTLPCGDVAVKRLHSTSGVREYWTELEVLSSLKHGNVVKLLGHCPEEQALVFEYVGEGSLDQYLGEDGKKLTWQQKFGVISGLGSALAVLHSASPVIVHRDLKPANVLIAADGTAKLADVGIARSLEEGFNKTYSVSGTIGYMDPEMMRTYEISPASDVYAFGLIALQLLLDTCNVTAIHRLLAKLPCNWMSSAAGFAVAVKTIQEQVVASAGESGTPTFPREVLTALVYLALSCVKRSAAARPDMNETVIPALRAMEKKLAPRPLSIAPGVTSPGQTSSPKSAGKMIGRATAALSLRKPRASAGSPRAERHPASPHKQRQHG